jgi:hypothetical protein
VTRSSSPAGAFGRKRKLYRDGAHVREDQTGEFIVTVRGAQVRVEMEGMYGIGAMPIPGFSAHVVEPNNPFISETGYRSFIGYQPEIPPGTTPDKYACFLIEHYLDRECKGKLASVEAGVHRKLHRGIPRTVIAPTTVEWWTT